MIGNGIESALKYGIKAPGLVGIYLLVMFLLGHHFDSDPIYPWASEILADDSIAHQGEKIHLLHAKAMALLEQVLS